MFGVFFTKAWHKIGKSAFGDALSWHHLPNSFNGEVWKGVWKHLCVHVGGMGWRGGVGRGSEFTPNWTPVYELCWAPTSWATEVISICCLDKWKLPEHTPVRFSTSGLLHSPFTRRRIESEQVVTKINGCSLLQADSTLNRKGAPFKWGSKKSKVPLGHHSSWEVWPTVFSILF